MTETHPLFPYLAVGGCVGYGNQDGSGNGWSENPSGVLARRGRNAETTCSDLFHTESDS